MIPIERQTERRIVAPPVPRPMAVGDLALHRAITDWTALLGPTQVLNTDAATLAYQANTIGAKRRIGGALRITSRDSLPEVMRIARRYRIPVYPISTGRNWGYGAALPIRDDCAIIDLSGLNRILHFDAELGVVTVEPGVTQGMLADFLDQGRHPFMVPVTGAGPRCSLIGNVLERGYGITPHADHFAAMTDFEAVLADGTLHRTTLRDVGGDDLARLFKWGIGPYSAGLFSQSGLGIVTQMSLVLAPRPECVKVCIFSVRDEALLEPVIGTVRAQLARFPGIIGGINLMNQHRVLAMTVPFPVDRLGPDGLVPAAVIEELGRAHQIAPWTGLATLYGSAGVVRAAQKELRAALRGTCRRVVFLSPGQARMLATAASWLPGQTQIARTMTWLSRSLELVAGRPNETALPLAYWRRGVMPSTGPLDPARDGCGLIWYSPLVPMRGDGVRHYVEMVKQVTRAHGIEPLVTLTSLSDRLFDSTVPLLFDPAMVESARACYGELLSSGRRLGCFPYRLSVDSMTHARSHSSGSARLHERIRESLDPDGILAPGRYL